MSMDIEKKDRAIPPCRLEQFVTPVLLPFYQDESVTIYHGDAREVMKHIDVVDLVLTDPPYGIGLDYDGGFVDTKEYIEELAITLLPTLKQKAQCVAVTPGIVNLSKWPDANWCLAWTWTHTGTIGKYGFNQWGPILVWGTDPKLRRGKGRLPDVIVCAGDEPLPEGHPCPKPIRAWGKILNRLSEPGDIVLDPFMGSGTTLRVAKDSGRKAVGIEISEKYCEIAAKRMAQEVLF